MGALVHLTSRATAARASVIDWRSLQSPGDHSTGRRRPDASGTIIFRHEMCMAGQCAAEGSTVGVSRRRRGRAHLLCVGLLASLLSACDLVGLCFTEAGSFGIQVTVVDGTTMRGPRGPVTLTVTGGAATETRTSSPNPSEVPTIVGAVESAGTYSLRVEADGYAPLNIRDVRVSEDRCGRVNTTRIQARLQPTASSPP